MRITYVTLSPMVTDKTDCRDRYGSRLAFVYPRPPVDCKETNDVTREKEERDSVVGRSGEEDGGRSSFRERDLGTQQVDVFLVCSQRQAKIIGLFFRIYNAFNIQRLIGFNVTEVCWANSLCEYVHVPCSNCLGAHLS